MTYRVLSFFKFLHFHNLVFLLFFQKAKFFFSIFFPIKKGIKIQRVNIPPKLHITAVKYIYICKY